MPELPEVETIRRGLEPYFAGHKIIFADIKRKDLRWPFPNNMKKRLEGCRVLHVGRRSKYLLVGLDSGETLIIHFGMSGRMEICPFEAGENLSDFQAQIEAQADKHDHVILGLDTGHFMKYNDPRRFGVMDLCQTDALEAHPLLAHLGPEPLENRFDDIYLAKALLSRKMPIKSALLDQRIIAGLGNIYVCEALWRTRISPILPAHLLESEKIMSLTSNIRNVISEAIEAGGSTLKDYRQADGKLGYFQHNFAVYGREGQDCHHTDCDGIISRITQSGRSTFYCARCQRGVDSKRNRK